MSFKTSNVKATPGNIRRRLFAIEAAASSARQLAERWNPKGRHYETMRELNTRLPAIEDAARLLRHLLERTPRFNPTRELARRLKL